MAGFHYTLTFTIPAGTKVSTETYNLGAVVPVGVYMPAAWDAADLGFDVSLDGSSWLPLYGQDAAETVVKVAAGKANVINSGDYIGFPYIRIRSGAGAGVNQTSTRTVKVVVRAA